MPLSAADAAEGSPAEAERVLRLQIEMAGGGGGVRPDVCRARPEHARRRGRQRLRRGVALRTQNQNIAVPPGSGKTNTSSPNSKTTAYGENDYQAGVG